MDMKNVPKSENQTLREKAESIIKGIRENTSLDESEKCKLINKIRMDVDLNIAMRIQSSRVRG